MRKTVLKFVVLTLILALAFTLGASAVVTAPGPVVKPINYVALGDSIAAGYGVEADERYPELLSGMLIENGYAGEVNLTNLAVRGYKTDDLLAKLKDEAYIKALKDANVVTVSIGSNNVFVPVIEYFAAQSDLGITVRDLSEDSNAALTKLLPALMKAVISSEFTKIIDDGVAQLKDELPKVLEEIKKLAPDAEVYLCTVLRLSIGNTLADNYIDSIIKRLNDVIEAAGGQKLCTVVDTYSLFEALNEGFPDIELTNGLLDPHPSADGHYAIAAEHCAVITGLETPPLRDDDYAVTGVLDGLSPWAVDKVTSLYNRGILFNDILDDYQSKITRAEFTQLIINVFANAHDYTGEQLQGMIETGNFPDYADVKEHAFADAIGTASRLGIINGRSDSVFDPDGTLARQECAKISLLTVALIDDSVVYDDALRPEFSDNGLVAEWALPYVANAAKYGVMNGRGAGVFDPVTPLSREEAMIVVENLIVSFNWDI